MSIRRRALFSSASHAALTTERDHAARWYSGQSIVKFRVRESDFASSEVVPMLRAGIATRYLIKDLAAETHADPAAGVSGEVPPPGQTGDGEG